MTREHVNAEENSTQTQTHTHTQTEAHRWEAFHVNLNLGFTQKISAITHDLDSTAMAGNQREKEPSVAQEYVEAIDVEEKEDDQELNRQRSRN